MTAPSNEPDYVGIISVGINVKRFFDEDILGTAAPISVHSRESGNPDFAAQSALAAKGLGPRFRGDERDLPIQAEWIRL
jgi:hypothetical protein